MSKQLICPKCHSVDTRIDKLEYSNIGQVIECLKCAKRDYSFDPNHRFEDWTLVYIPGAALLASLFASRTLFKKNQVKGGQ